MVGYKNRFNQWKSIDELRCDELIVQFEAKQTKSALIVTPVSAFEYEAVVESQSSQPFGVGDCEALKAVEHLTRKPKLEGAAAEFLHPWLQYCCC